MIKFLGPKEMVKEVCVFEIGGGVDKGKWVVRCFDFSQLGDAVSDTKPTEDELKDYFENPDLLVRYEYDLVSSKFIDLINSKLKDWTPRRNLILALLSRNEEE